MIVRSTARLMYVSIPPKKMRLVVDMIKGKPVEEALNLLNFTPKIAAHHIAKTLKSAAANALSIEGTDHLKPEELRISKIFVDPAPTAKRIRFQSMGRVFRYRKRFSHLTINLEGVVDAPVVETKAPTKAKKEVVEPKVKKKTKVAGSDSKKAKGKAKPEAKPKAKPKTAKKMKEEK